MVSLFFKEKHQPINPINPSTTPIVPASKPQDASDKLQPLKSSLVGWNVTPLSIILETLSYREANNPLLRSWFVHFPGVQNEGTDLKWIHPQMRGITSHAIVAFWMLSKKKRSPYVILLVETATGEASQIKCGWVSPLMSWFPLKQKLYSLSFCGQQAMYHSHQTTKNKL